VRREAVDKRVPATGDWLDVVLLAVVAIEARWALLRLAGLLR